MSRLHPENVVRAREAIARYPRPRSALIPLLHLAQEQDGYLDEEAMAHVAELLDLAPAEVLGTASFYEMFKRHPMGRYLIGVCTNISCMLDGAYELLDHAERSLGVKVGGTTDDGQFSLETMECIAACGGAPCVQVNYRYFERMTSEGFDCLVADLRAGRFDDDIPPHGTLGRVRPPQPVTDPHRKLPEDIHPETADKVDEVEAAP
jgi:NADH-quinone oxidoreductase subunit E